MTLNPAGLLVVRIDGCTRLTDAGSTMTSDAYPCLLVNVVDDIMLTSYDQIYGDFSRPVRFCMWACYVRHSSY